MFKVKSMLFWSLSLVNVLVDYMIGTEWGG